MTAPNPHLQPKSKAAPVVRGTRLSVAANNSPSASRSSSSARPPKARKDAPKGDYTSAKATHALIRRVLAPETGHGADPRASPRPVEDLLPPLTSSNEVDVQLYALIAIVVKDLVNSWYGKITPDHVFVEEVIQIIAHCSRALEQRLRRIDVEELVLDEIPALLEQHVVAYRTAYGAGAAPPYGSMPPQIYHALNPHPALSPLPAPNQPEAVALQQQNEATYRQLLVQGALAVLLPTEDLENACLRTLVGDVIADLILGQAVAGKLCEGWFVHETISKVVEIVNAHVEPKASGAQIQTDARSRLEKFGLLSSKSDDKTHHSSKSHQSSPSAIFWRIMQYGYLAFLFLRFAVLGVSRARYLPPRLHQAPSRPGSSAPQVSTPALVSTPRAGGRHTVVASPAPVLTYRIFAFISTVLDMLTRMPWLTSSLVFCQHVLTRRAGGFGATNSLLDKFLHETLHTHLLPPSLLVPLLQNLRVTLFPANTLGPPAPPPPSPAEALAIRRQAAIDVLSLLPEFVKTTFWATDEEEGWIAEVEEMLMAFGEANLNKYWIYGMVELVLIRLIPEMGEKGWSELVADRGVMLDLGPDAVPGAQKVGSDSQKEGHEKPENVAQGKGSGAADSNK